MGHTYSLPRITMCCNLLSQAHVCAHTCAIIPMLHARHSGSETLSSLPEALQLVSCRKCTLDQLSWIKLLQTPGYALLEWWSSFLKMGPQRGI